MAELEEDASVIAFFRFAALWLKQERSAVDMVEGESTPETSSFVYPKLDKQVAVPDEQRFIIFLGYQSFK